MCVFAISARVSCSVALKLAVVAGGTGGQVIAGLTLPVLRFAESYPSISAFSVADDGHFLIIVPVDFWILPEMSEQVMAAQKENIGKLQREMDSTVAEMQRSVITYAAEIKAMIAEVQYILSFLTSNMLMLLAYNYVDA